MLAHGIDIVDLIEFRRLIEQDGKHFIPRCFTPAEQADAGEGLTQIERLAARFAAKEAVVKALGEGWGAGIAWTDVEIRTEQSGAPRVVLYGRAAVIATERGMSNWVVSISHTSSLAAASVLAVAEA